MAQAFFERHAPDDNRAESAGTDPRKEGVWPDVVEVMREVGVDLAGRRPRRLDLEMQLHADWAVTMGCGDVCPYVPTRVEDWALPDPAGRPIEEVRAIRDDIERRVRALIDGNLPAIRSDRTAHQMRLARLLPGLAAEFGASHTAEQIRACTDEMLEEFIDVPVRSFVLTLARRKTERCLRSGHCAPAATP
jgi:arsenate reductase